MFMDNEIFDHEDKYYRLKSVVGQPSQAETSSLSTERLEQQLHRILKHLQQNHSDLDTVLPSPNTDKFREVHRCVLYHRSGHLNKIMLPLNVFILESVSLQLILFLMIKYECISLAPCALQSMIKSEMPVVLHAAGVLEEEETQPVIFEAW